MNKFVSFLKWLINLIKSWFRKKLINKASSEFEPESIVLKVFNQLRGEFNLGVSEYLAAIQAIKGGLENNNPERLKEILQLLWCPPVERYQFDLVWKSVTFSPKKPDTKSLSPKIKSGVKNSPKSSEKLQQEISQSRPPDVEPIPVQFTADLTPVPVRAPSNSAKVDETLEIQNYWPISRRSMVYIWRYLQRPVADGAEDLLDINATVDKAVNQGFFLAPVYRRRESNNVHLLLLVDQKGSMTPFQRFSRDLIETAQYESTIEQVNVYYFHNVPDASLYHDPYLTKPILLEEVLKDCDNDTNIFIVSDAGAARGYRRLERIQETTEALFNIKQLTSQIVWLNPMPQKRWVGSSAQIISNLIPMYQMDKDGLSNAINHVWNQPIQKKIATNLGE